jgi:hypothetical protein
MYILHTTLGKEFYGNWMNSESTWAKVKIDNLSVEVTFAK